jgi:hypothetical protein
MSLKIINSPCTNPRCDRMVPGFSHHCAACRRAARLGALLMAIVALVIIIAHRLIG